MRSLALFALPLLAFLACNKDDSVMGAVDGGPRTEADHLVLPMVVSLQGTLQSEGLEQRRGALVAVQQLNALGGILGRQVEMEFLDDNSDPVVAAGYAGQLAQLKSPVVFGPTGSPAAAALIAAAPNQLFISPSATSPVLDSVADGGVTAESFFFRTAPSDTLLAKGLALLANGTSTDATVVHCASISIINSDDDYGRPIGAGVENLFKLLSNSVTSHVAVPGTVQSPDYYNGIAQSLVGAEKNCQLIIAPAEIGAEYVRAFYALQQQTPGRDWSKFQTFGANALHTDAFLRASLIDPTDPTKPNPANGIHVVAPDTTPENPNFSAFRSLYNAQYPTDPIGLSANTYDAVIVAALALEAAGAGADSAKVRDSLLDVSKLGTAYGPAKVADALQEIRRGADIDYVGASGSLDFDRQGQVLTDFLVYQVVSGAFVNTSRFARSDLQ